MSKRRYDKKKVVSILSSAEVTDLLGRKKVLTTGVIKYRKPFYVHDKRHSRTFPIAYVISIQTPHVTKINNINVPVFISAWGKYSSWFYYRKLEKNQERIGVSGIRRRISMYKGSLWIILERSPAPLFWYIGGQQKSIDSEDVIVDVKMPAMLI